MLDFFVPSIMHLGIVYVLFQDDIPDIPNDLDSPLRFVKFVLENLVSRDFVGLRCPRRRCLFCTNG